VKGKNNNKRGGRQIPSRVRTQPSVSNQAVVSESGGQGALTTASAPTPTEAELTPPESSPRPDKLSPRTSPSSEPHNTQSLMDASPESITVSFNNLSIKE